jgi:hypothetical protein
VTKHRWTATGGWVRAVPGALIWGGACLLLAGYGTQWSAILLFSLYLGVGVMLPGVLVWRWLRGNVDGFAVDLAFGTGLGFALSILTYVPGRAIGVPVLPLIVPIATLVAFLVVPGLRRRHWRSDRAPMPLWWSYSVAAAAVLGLWVITRYGLEIEPIGFPDAAFQYSDMSYQLALAGEVKHHMPGQIPFVIGESLNYHWFLHAEVAAANWQTGIELDLLLRRLFPVMAALLPILSVAALTTRLARRSWAGPLAAWLLITVTSFDVYGWGGRALISQAAYSSGVLMYSLTHAFAVVLALPVVWVIVCLLRNDTRKGNWVLLAVGLAALADAKASFVPMLLAATVLVIAVKLVTDRKVDRVTVGLAASALVALVFAQVVLFSTGSSGIALEPGQSLRALASRVGFGSHYHSPVAAIAVLSTTGATLLVSWAMAGAGMLGFLTKRMWKDPAAVFLTGFLVAGLAAGVLLRHPGFSQLYFVRATFPVAIAASAWGLTILLDKVRLRELLPRMAIALAAGMLMAKILRAVTPDRPTKKDGLLLVSIQVIWPWLAVLLVAAAAALILRKTRERALALGLGVLVVFGVGSAWIPRTAVTTLTDQVCVSGPERPECRHTRRQIPAGGAQAARYIRDHSAVTDRLATNSHCTPVYGDKQCDARNFWLSGYAERRVLVEGWAYTPTAQSRKDGKGAINGPFWDQRLLAANDRAFRDPTAADLNYLRTTYNVRWLVFDTNLNRPSAQLERIAPHRYSSGAVEVYELVPPSTPETASPS